LKPLGKIVHLARHVIHLAIERGSSHAKVDEALKQCDGFLVNRIGRTDRTNILARGE
jgi:hypothetical protein